MNQNSIETVLREIARGQRPSTYLTIQYDDLHGLWGGLRISMSGDGRYEVQRQGRGEREASIERGLVKEADIRAIASLLVEIQAWKQITPDRPPLPDESRATLTVQVGETRTTIWEWYNEMDRNDRLIRIRDSLLATAVAANSR